MGKSGSIGRWGPKFVIPYRLSGKRGKNDAADAAAICEAVTRPNMRFVPIETVELQSLLCVHRLREGFKAERTACINRIRGLLVEFGLVFPQKPEALRLAPPEVLEDASNEFGGIARLALQRAQAQWAELEPHLAWCDERIAFHLKTDEQAARAQQLMGVGPVGASAAVATVDDFSRWCGRHTSAMARSHAGCTACVKSTAGKRPLWLWPTRTPAFCGR